MTVTLRPPANTFAAFAKGSNASASARESASRDDEASSAAAPAGTREGARRAVSKAVTYDRKTLFELRDANARVTSELPVELATSALEIVKNELNAAIAREQGSGWGKLQTKAKPAEESKGEKVGTTVEVLAVVVLLLVLVVVARRSPNRIMTMTMSLTLSMTPAQRQAQAATAITRPV